MGEWNLWKCDLIAGAYFYQQRAAPYVELITTTESYLHVTAGDWWLDLGCGSGRLIESIWKKSRGRVGKIIGLDLSYRNLRIAKTAIKRAGTNLTHRNIQFVQADISRGLGLFRPNSFNGVTAGLCVSYAEHWDPIKKGWDLEAYIGLMKDLFAVLKREGTLILSLNVPRPNFARIALLSWKQILFTWRAPLYIAVSLIMLFQSHWLKRCAATGRFHYLPANEVVHYLELAGFDCVTYAPTYAGQAWVFSAVKSSK